MRPAPDRRRSAERRARVPTGTAFRTHTSTWNAVAKEAPRSRKEILLVGSDSRWRERAAEALSAQSYGVLVADTWVSAVAMTAVHDGCIDLLITDLPQPLALELARRMRIVFPALPVVFTRWNDRSRGLGDTLERAPDAAPTKLVEEVSALLGS